MACTRAQPGGGRPVSVVVAYPAGGDTDALARLCAEGLAPRLGRPVVVDNRPGASGTVGSAHVARAAPDGDTLLQPGDEVIAMIKRGARLDVCTALVGNGATH